MADSKSKPMTEQAKQRLRELAAAKKGRTTLAGLDVGGFSAAMDALQDGDPRVQFPMPNSILHDVFRAVNLTTLRYTFMRTEKRRDAAGSPRTYFGSTITHVRLKGAQDYQREAIVMWLGAAAAVPIVYQSYAGPVRGLEDRAEFLYPVVPMLRLFFAIWQDEWKEKVAKYMHGHTAAHVRYLSPSRSGVLPDALPPGWMAALKDDRHGAAVNDLTARGLIYDTPKPAA